MKKIKIFILILLIQGMGFLLNSCVGSDQKDNDDQLKSYEKIIEGDPADFYNHADLKSITDTSQAFRSSRVPRDLGTRIPLTKDDVDLALGRYISWRGRVAFPNSTSYPGQRVIPGATFSFGIDEIKDLIADIEKSDQVDNITGFRIQIYEKALPGSNGTRMLDAFIVPVNIDGVPIPNAIFPKEQDECPGCLGLNESNPCPDNC